MFRARVVALSVVIALWASAVAAPAAADSSVVVAPGDNLLRIAMRHGSTVPALVQANGLHSPDVIYIGQRLRIPGAAGTAGTPGSSANAGGTHIVLAGENLSRIAQRYGTTTWALVRSNGLSSADRIYIGQRLRIPGAAAAGHAGAAPASGGSHVVTAGENLLRIAMRYGTTVSALVRANGLRSKDVIYAGQGLVIPAGGYSAPSAAPSAPVGVATGRHIVIDLTDQRLTAYQDGAHAASFPVSTGKSGTPTPLGTFRIYNRYRTQHMSGPGYSLPGVPYVQYFTGAYAIHGTYWHNSFGAPVSHGCINMRTGDAAWLWSWAGMGTPVTVQH